MRTETFQTPGAVRLDIRNGAGEVRLDASDSRQETVVTLEPMRDNDASNEAVQSARVELHERADGQEVVIDVRGRSKWGFRGAEVLVAVTCPVEPAVEIKTGSADIEGRGLFKRIDIETGSGDVQFAEFPATPRSAPPAVTSRFPSSAARPGSTRPQEMSRSG